MHTANIFLVLFLMPLGGRRTVGVQHCRGQTNPNSNFRHGQTYSFFFVETKFVHLYAIESGNHIN